MHSRFNNILQYSAFVETDLNQLVGDQLLSYGINKSIFDSVNNVKKALLEKISNEQTSDQELAAQIKELVDNTFVCFTFEMMEKFSQMEKDN